MMACIPMTEENLNLEADYLTFSNVAKLVEFGIDNTGTKCLYYDITFDTYVKVSNIWKNKIDQYESKKIVEPDTNSNKKYIMAPSPLAHKIFYESYKEVLEDQIKNQLTLLINLEIKKNNIKDEIKDIKHTIKSLITDSTDKNALKTWIKMEKKMVQLKVEKNKIKNAKKEIFSAKENLQNLELDDSFKNL